MASALAGSMSSLTAMQILPQSARSEAAPCRPRQTSVRAVPRANCRKITLRKLVNGSCISTRLMPRMPSWSRRCVRNIGSKATFFITLDSLGVTWLMMETKTGLRLCGDRGHLHRHVEVFERDMAVALAERAFRLEQFAVDQALDHDLGVGRHVQVDARPP